ncbi:MAG: hypothetical protein HOE90_14575 [Bacteriovoracaceae bacterium]|jgi:hypothetical protein|nr:hypothetical protein [Bacteriovoracaceae bacterium]
MRSLLVLALFSLFATTGFSGALEDAKDAWAKRGYDAAGVANAQLAADTYKTLADSAAGVTKAEYLFLQGEALYFVGAGTADNKVKIQKHEEGFAAAGAAFALAKSEGDNDLWAKAKYFWGANKGKWGLASGPAKVIKHKKYLIEAMNELMAAGYESVFDYGPHRILGKLYGTLPGLLGGDKKLAVYHLSYALENTRNDLDEPVHGINVNYVGEIFPSAKSSKYQGGLELAVERATAALEVAEDAGDDAEVERLEGVVERLETMQEKSSKEVAKEVLTEFVAAVEDATRDGRELNSSRKAETASEVLTSKSLLAKL